MIPSVHVTNSVNNYHSASMVLNRGYGLHGRRVDNGPRPHKVSTKILVFGIFMVGVVVLFVGLIIGMEFPVYVSEKILKDQCILNKDHMFYEKWYRDEAYSRYNRLYYWTIDNVNGFINGAVPKFVEKGPYIYKETRQYINVAFANNRISYQAMVRQTFVSEATRSECGDACSQNDNITIINTNFLRKMYSHGSWDGYVYSQVSDYLRQLFNNWTTKHNNFTNLVTYLGCVTQECTNQMESISFISKDDIRQVSFGAFVRMKDTNDKLRFLQSDKFVTPEGFILTNVLQTLYTQLLEVKVSDSKSCDSVLGHNNVSWAVHVTRADNATLPNTFINNKTHSDPTFRRINFTRTCGFSYGVLLLINHMLQFSGWPSSTWSLSMLDGTNKTFDEVKETFERVLSFFQVAKDYADVHLLNIVGDMERSMPENSITETRHQHQLAIGYTYELSNHDTSRPLHVEGILPHHADIMDAFVRSPAIVVSTCLDGNHNYNMAVREYNRSEFAPSGLYQNNNHRQFGYTTYFPQSHIFRACSMPFTKEGPLDVFIDDIYRSLTFIIDGETVKFDNDVYRYTMSTGASAGTTPCQLINTSSVYGYLSYVGAPVFQNSLCQHLADVMTLQSTQHTSHIEVEPRTGSIWGQSIKLQRSTVILPVYLGGTTYPTYRNMTYTNIPIPLFWVDRRTEIVQTEIENYEYKIKRLMNVSCGGLIGLVTVSMLIMALSVFIGLLSTRKNKVDPTVDEASVSQRA